MHQLSLLEQGISIEVTKRWETFDFQFAYYILSIDNVIKCGAVGLNNSESSDNLDARFYSHRNTHARFYLVNVFQFHDSKSVTSFENFIKMVFLEYSLGKGNGSLEQYECKDQDTVAFINRTVIEIFEVLKEKNPRIGSTCPKEKIEKYNLSVRERTNN